MGSLQDGATASSACRFYKWYWQFLCYFRKILPKAVCVADRLS